MPPKRKAAETTSENGPAKVAKAPSTRDKKLAAKAATNETTASKTTKAAKATKTAKTANTTKASKGSKQIEAAVDKKVFDQDRCDAWFKTYTGQEDDEDFDPYQIGPNGIAKLCDDIGVSLEGVDMLVLAFHLKADTMPIFTKEEWTKGMKILGVDSAEKLKAKMPTLVERLKNPQQFKEFYRYIFMFAKDSEQKCMPLETACAMIQTVMKGRPHEKRFVEFLEVKKPVKVINKDQWYNFLDFSDSIAEDMSNYDGASSAWPVLLDEYVEWRNEESS